MTSIGKDHRALAVTAIGGAAGIVAAGALLPLSSRIARIPTPQYWRGDAPLMAIGVGAGIAACSMTSIGPAIIGLNAAAAIGIFTAASGKPFARNLAANALLVGGFAGATLGAGYIAKHLLGG